MFACNLALPTYHMTAGESKSFIIPVFNESGTQIDTTGMTARFAIADYVNLNSKPYVIKECSVLSQEGERVSVLSTALDPADTVHLYGKFIYQITGIAADGATGPMRGILHISPNNDPGAITN